MKTEPLTMVRILHNFNAGERAIMCKALQEHTVQYSGAHQGLLPFIKIEIVCNAVASIYVYATEHLAVYQKLLVKLRCLKSINENRVSRLYLDDGKVAKWFGKRPELGRALPISNTKKVICGVKWSLPKQDYIADTEVLVKTNVSLRCVKKGLWEVSCQESERKQVELWLIDHCR